MLDELLTVEELAKRLKVSLWTIRSWVSQQYVPFFKLNRFVRFRAKEVERWLVKNQKEGRSLYRLKIEAKMAVSK